MPTYFVDIDDPTANDGPNDGSEGKPFKTLERGVRHLLPGDTLKVKGQTPYAEQVNCANDGEPHARITIENADGHKPIIDGTAHMPKQWAGLLNVSGNYNTVRGFEVRHTSKWKNNNRAIRLWNGDGKARSTGIILSDCHAWDTHDSPITLIKCNNALVERCRTAEGGKDGEDAVGYYWAGAGVIVSEWCDTVTVRNCIAYEGGGEQFMSDKGARNVTFEDNIAIRPWSAGFYVNQGQNITFRRNVVWGKYPVVPSSAFGAANEDDKYHVYPPCDNVLFENNLAVHSWQCMHIDPYNIGGGIAGITVRHNTFISGLNANGEAPRADAACIYFGRAANRDPHTGISYPASINKNCLVENNIFARTSGAAGINPAYVDYNAGASSVTWRNNYWPIAVAAEPSGSGDQIGDPGLANINAVLDDDTGGDVLDYILTAGSGAIGNAIASGITTDFFLGAR